MNVSTNLLFLSAVSSEHKVSNHNDGMLFSNAQTLYKTPRQMSKSYQRSNQEISFLPTVKTYFEKRQQQHMMVATVT